MGIFESGRYIPLRAAGRFKEHVVAFARSNGEQWSITVAPRFLTALVKDGQYPFTREVWDDTHMVVSKEFPQIWKEQLTEQVMETDKHIYLRDTLKSFPVSLLINEAKA
jgi:(1->4)-alpha-D-glucan 1-alpha-D-glucosylmutase